MYKVKRAIIMAAGKGTRLNPITENIPKPLVDVNGKIIIETIIEALKYNGINEIYVVVGYLKEKFYYLEDKYKGLKLIENKYYDKCNNISSLYVARQYIEDCIILDGDQIIYNKNILTPYFEKSGYNCVWTDEYTKEWLLTLKDDKVVGCNKDGGKQGYQLYSISRWNKEDGRRLVNHIKIEFIKNNNTQIYWDDVPMFCYLDSFDLGIFKMNKNDVVEIDTLEELVNMDDKYKNNLNV